jgi:DNA ligase (NAD+)
MPMKRDIVTQMIVKKGGTVRGISKNTNYLVTDDPNSGSVKNKKAQSYGTTIIDFDGLMELIEG